MIPKGLFTQIGMVVISVFIIITYVEPAFQEIAEVQDNIARYQDERARVTGVNDRLRSLAGELDRVSYQDQERLLKYLPDADKVDQVGVPRDLSIIAEEAGVLFKSAAYLGSVSDAPRSSKNTRDKEMYPEMHNFSFEVEGTYQQLKDLFLLMEQNQYPLQVQELTIKPMDGVFLSASMSVTTFSFKSELGDKQIDF